MLKYILIGGALAFTASIQPGPLQAYLFSRVTAIGWRRTLPAAFAPLLSDGPIALLALLVLGQLSEPLPAKQVLPSGRYLILLLRRLWPGGVLFLYFRGGDYWDFDDVGGKREHRTSNIEHRVRVLLL